MKTHTLLALALAGALFAIQTAGAQEPQPQTQVEVKAVVAIPYRGDVAAIDAGAKTFTLKGKSKERIFAITSTTKLLKDGSPATWEDLKVGEAVRGSAIKKTEGQYEAVSVKFGAKTPVPGQAKTE